MNIDKQEEVTYAVTDITQTQATNLLSLCITLNTNPEQYENDVTLDELETLNDLREVLLNAGVGRNN